MNQSELDPGFEPSLEDSVTAHHTHGQVGKRNDLCEHVTQFVEICAVVNAAFDNIGVFVVIRPLHNAADNVHALLDVREVVEHSLRPRKNQRVQELNEDELALVQRQKCQRDAIQNRRKKHTEEQADENWLLANQIADRTPIKVTAIVEKEFLKAFVDDEGVAELESQQAATGLA